MKREIVHREEVLEVGAWEKIIGDGKHQLQDGVSKIDTRTNETGSVHHLSRRREDAEPLHAFRPVLVNKRSERGDLIPDFTGIIG